ncbi:hypothetical protein Pla108_23780 [Botrimarina colliarenosi]|uniref:Uncharacterized protein n=1 Tax=Botrimarina colliarenosi TaxID=2528001 RepID=A0A5C6AAM4_9BACT|nr:hypothetical protein [Botrimarina colliarenosi]TWT96609.1 hypothetical protein Pla108_23780 [Botrimarina colliarenosi]
MALARSLALLMAVALATPAGAQFWNPFRSKPQAEPAAAPVRQASAQEPLRYKLTEESGPWLILATTFSGEGAEAQARQLCAELTQTLRLPAYVHEMNFDLAGDEPVGRGVDRYGAPVKMRYRSGDERREWAVLVGDYPSVDDTIASRDLLTVKSVKPQALAIDAEGQTRQNLANYRAMTAMMTAKDEGDGPMRSAFMTRNPLLPDEFFAPKGVDKFLEKMNKDLDYTALAIPGRKTIRVATFRGRGTLVGASQSRSSKSRRKDKEIDPLVEAAENAHFLCEEMRSKGWEAYEFHDRTESWVSVGSFDKVFSDDGQPLAEAVEIVRTFGAAHNTSSTPLDKQRNAPVESARAAQVKQQFNNLFTSEIGQVATGMNPKYAQVTFEKGQAPRPIPFDIYPEAVDAPKRSVSSGFAWRR